MARVRSAPREVFPLSHTHNRSRQSDLAVLRPGHLQHTRASLHPHLSIGEPVQDAGHGRAAGAGAGGRGFPYPALPEANLNFAARENLYELYVRPARKQLVPFYFAPQSVPVNGRKVADEQRAVGVAHGSNRDREHSPVGAQRSEEHTSELQSRLHLVCRLLLEKKKKKRTSV